MFAQEFKIHQKAYLVLMAGLLLITVAFFAAWPSRLWQRVLALMISFFYFGWGVITHLKTNHITQRVIWEYFGVAAIAAISLLLITF